MTLIYDKTYIKATKVIYMTICDCIMSVEYINNGWFKRKTKIETKGYKLEVSYVDELNRTVVISWKNASRPIVETVFNELLKQIRAQDPNFMDELFETAIKNS